MARARPLTALNGDKPYCTTSSCCPALSPPVTRSSKRPPEDTHLSSRQGRVPELRRNGSDAIVTVFAPPPTGSVASQQTASRRTGPRDVIDRAAWPRSILISRIIRIGLNLKRAGRIWSENAIFVIQQTPRDTGIAIALNKPAARNIMRDRPAASVCGDLDVCHYLRSPCSVIEGRAWRFDQPGNPAKPRTKEP